MAPTHQANPELYVNLIELAHGTFPKRCNNCGTSYQTVEEFVQATLNINPQRSGLKQGFDDDGDAIIELFRNCRCGSTLMDVFQSRRDVTQAGAQRREHFDRLVVQLVESGVPVAEAKVSILKWLRGQDSALERMRIIHP